MSHGSNGKEAGISRLRPGSPAKGFTLVELMLVCLILVGLFGTLFMTLSAGDSSIAVNSEKIDVQARARMIMDWVTRDLRGAISWEINANNPTASYVKLNVWSWDAANNTWQLGPNFIEYSYDAGGSALRRRLVDDHGSVLEEAVFPGVTQAPFYTAYVDQFNNQFDRNDLLAKRKLIVVIRTSRAARGRTVGYTLVEEVKIRNG